MVNQTKWHMDKMVYGRNGILTKRDRQNGMDKTVQTKWYEQNGMDKMVQTKWYGQNGMDKMVRMFYRHQFN